MFTSELLREMQPRIDYRTAQRSQLMWWFRNRSFDLSERTFRVLTFWIPWATPLQHRLLTNEYHTIQSPLSTLLIIWHKLQPCQLGLTSRLIMVLSLCNFSIASIFTFTLMSVYLWISSCTSVITCTLPSFVRNGTRAWLNFDGIIFVVWSFTSVKEVYFFPYKQQFCIVFVYVFMRS